MNVFDLTAKITLDQSEYNDGIIDAGAKLSKFGDTVKKGLATAAKVGGAAIAAFSGAAIAVGKQAVSAYADYEQLVGGIETLFEDLSWDVGQNAAQAFKTAGISANEYMETAMSFAASLNQSLLASDGNIARAADMTDKAIIDMADNANKMGSSMESIQSAYQGFAKQNYTMLDNLKLGYGGTKEEMERLVKDAEGLDSSFKATRDENGDLAMSFADIVDAIHIVQTEMGITGTTAKEASSTISGSISSAKAAWQNLLVGLADPEADLDSLIDDFFDSVVTVGENLMPKVEKVLGSLAAIIPKALNKLFPIINKVLQANLPTLIEGGTQLLVSLIDGIVQALPILIEMLPQVIETIVNTLRERWPEIQAAGGELLTMLWDGIQAAWGWFTGIVSEQFGLIKDNLLQNWQTMKDDAARTWEGIKTAILGKVNAIKTAVVQSWENIKSSIAEQVNAVKEGVSSAFESAKEKIRSAQEKVGEIIDKIKEKFEQLKKKADEVKEKFQTTANKIKDLFNFKFTMPKIKLPHFTVKPEGWQIGDLLKGVIPKLSVAWYKKAYENPYVFTKPTLAGFGDGNGGEIVYGHENLMKDIRDATSSAGIERKLDQLIALLADIAENGLDANIQSSQLYRSVIKENKVRTKATSYNALSMG